MRRISSTEGPGGWSVDRVRNCDAHSLRCMAKYASKLTVMHIANAASFIDVFKAKKNTESIELRNNVNLEHVTLEYYFLMYFSIIERQDHHKTFLRENVVPSDDDQRTKQKCIENTRD